MINTRACHKSITDLLVAEGFVIDEKKQFFKKDEIEISFSELTRHTVSSFIEKARAKGWLDPYGRSFEILKATEIADDAGSKTLSMAPRASEVLLGESNIPDSGFGS